MRLGRLFCALTLGVAAFTTSAAAKPLVTPSPCRLTTAADVKAVLGSAVGPGKAQALGLYRSCTYIGTGFFVTIQTRALSRSDFVKSAKMNPGPVQAIGGLGAPAYYVGRATLLVWRGGDEATFTIFASGSQLARELKLAKRALPRM